MINENNVLNDCIQQLNYPLKFIEDIANGIQELGSDDIVTSARKSHQEKDISGLVKSLKDLMIRLEGKGIYRPDAPVHLIRQLVNGLNINNEDIFQIISRSRLSLEEKLMEMEFLASCAAITQLGYLLLKNIGPEVGAASSGEHVFLIIDGTSKDSKIFVDFSIDSINEINMSIFEQNGNNWSLKKDADLSSIDNEIARYLTRYYSFFRLVYGTGLNHNIHNNLGLAYDKLGMFEKAIQEYNEALRIDPGYVEVCNNLAVTFHKMGKTLEAEKELKSAIRQNPLYLDARCNLGNIYSVSGRFEEAISENQHVLMINPNHARAHNNIGEIYYLQERKTEAMKEFNDALRIDPNSLTGHTNLGILFIELGRYDEAAEEFQKALDIDPAFSKAHFGTGLLHYELKNYEKASKAFIKAVQISPDHMDSIPEKLILKVKQGLSRCAF